MKVRRALYHGNTITYYCPECEQPVTTPPPSSITKNGHIQGFIDHCTVTDEFSFVFWDTDDES